MMAYSNAFFHFFKILTFWVVKGGGGGRGGAVKQQKWPKMTKNFVSLWISGTVRHDCGFWYTCVKWSYLQQCLFLFFKNSDFFGFSKTNKCQKQMLRCASSSSHLCDVLVSYVTFLSRFYGYMLILVFKCCMLLLWLCVIQVIWLS